MKNLLKLIKLIKKIGLKACIARIEGTPFAVQLKSIQKADLSDTPKNRSKIFYVVTLNGYYPIKWNTLKYSSKPLTKLSQKKGFIFDSEDKAREAFRRIMEIVR